MNAIDGLRGATAAAARAAAFASFLMVLVGIHTALTGRTPAAAADGPQAAPTIEPASVATRADAFSLRPPADARCDGTGADDWRWHGFIVEAGRDLSTLRFGPLGPGDDYDASDGQITAALLAAGGEGLWQKLPAIRPEGLINPDELAGLALDPTVYTLRDGDYELGFACTDGSLATRQWWSLTVTIKTSSEPFLTVVGDGPASPSSAGPALGTEPSQPTGAAPGAAAAVATSAASPSGATDSATTGAAEVPADEQERAGAATGVTWSPLVAVRGVSSLLPVGVWAVLVVAFARAAYLLARPVPVLPALAP